MSRNLDAYRPDPDGMPLPDGIEEKQARARAWFERLRGDICAAFEALEEALPADAPLAERPPGRFQRKPWQRTDHSGGDGGGGVMATMSGRVFEKVGLSDLSRRGEDLNVLVDNSAASRTLALPVGSAPELEHIAVELLSSLLPFPKTVRLLGVTLSSLVAGGAEIDPQLRLAL